DAMLTRILQTEGYLTLCLDEADKTIRPENLNTAAILNAGWSRDGYARLNLPKGSDWVPTRIPVFSPIAMAGNGVSLAADTRERTIMIRLHRDESAPELDMRNLEPAFAEVRSMLEQWAKDKANLGCVRRPPLPAEVRARDRDRWA